MKNDLYESLVEKVEKLIVVELEDNPINFAKFALLSKFIKTLKAIQLLDVNGYFEDAMMLVRTLFEIVLTVAYCEHNNLYIRYLSYSYVTRKRNLDILISNNIIEVPQDLKTEINEGFEKFKSDYQITNDRQLNTWNGISIKKTMLKVVESYNNDLIRHMYNAIYGAASGHIHSDSLSTSQYLGFEEISEKIIDYKIDPFPDEEVMGIFNDVSSLCDIFIAVFTPFISVENIESSL